MNFSLRVNRKQIATNSSPYRDQIGNFGSTGAKWDRSPVLVNDHDFPSDASGVGISHDTPAFAAHSIATWWKREGSRRWGRVPKLLVLADSGGSNSCRSWAWKTELQAQVCNPFGFTVMIAHYPTGASKWNPIEHRLFSETSKNWAAEPLDNYDKMLNFIRTTSTQTGLVGTAYLDRKEYPTGLKPDRSLISSLRLKHSNILPNLRVPICEGFRLMPPSWFLRFWTDQGGLG